MAKVDALGATTIQSLYTSLGTSLQPVFVTAMSVYAAFWGYQLLVGRQGVSAGDAVVRVARMAFIYMLAFSWGDFSTLVVNSLTNLPNAVGDAICSAVGGTNCSGTDAGVTQGLSSVWTAAMTVSTAMANNSGMFGLALMIFSYVVIAFAAVFVAFAAGVLILCKMALFVLLAIGPVFIVALLFPASSYLFDGWMRACVQFTVAQMLVFGFLGFFLILIQTTANDVQASTTTSAALTTVAPFLLMCVIGSFLLTQITAIAATIAGGQALGIRRIPWMMGKSGRGAQYAVGGAATLALATYQGMRSFVASLGQGRISSGEPAAKAQVRSALDANRH